jgi:hypothetical protein
MAESNAVLFANARVVMGRRSLLHLLFFSNQRTAGLSDFFCVSLSYPNGDEWSKQPRHDLCSQTATSELVIILRTYLLRALSLAQSAY